MAGIPADPSLLRLEDSGVIVKELHADQVLVHAATRSAAAFGLCIEYVWELDRDRLRGWILKALTLEETLNHTVLLVVVYLRPTAAAERPDRLVRRAGGKSNHHAFETVYLWEFAERIRSGELPELAPFLILWDHEDPEGTLRDEKELIQSAELPEPVKREVVGAAYLLGLKYASRRIVDAVFREEVMKLEEMGLIGERIAAQLAEKEALAWERGLSRGLEEGREQGLEKGLEEGREEGRAQGRDEEARELTMRILRLRFGVLPDSWTTLIAQLDAERCGRLLEQALQVESLAELNVSTE